MRKLLSIVIMLAIAILTGCSTSEVQKEGKPTIKIGYLPITHAAPLFVQEKLQQKNAHYKLELVKFSSWPDLMDALNTGRIDGASVLIQLAMKAKELGIDLKAVALGHREGNIVVTTPTITKVEQLKGQTFAIPNKYSTHNLLLHTMLKQHGLQDSDVNVVELMPAEMPAALSEGRIAGYIVAEPFGTVALALKKGSVLMKSDEIWKNSIDCGLVLRGDFIKNNKKITQHFVGDYAEAGEVAEKKDAFLQQQIHIYSPVKPEIIEQSLQWISYDHLTISRQEYEKLGIGLQEMKLAKEPPSYDEFVDATLLTKKE
ncbi:ABC transporter substrate-binding protein [Kurthia sibirica]|uniref:Metal ABC transporter substrate-binding protein n=1 Tax=Kurthia sibirica TaxID=202750 RepID=A0A2U3ALQ3_9BACL|nr:ABC transporter substrate-binding protein [Kurthia sibirica]PWI25465.1 metal ABC transporter substrate-binding protein [Kurthia sibirica]GEK34954.1 hypothetical protein KSI01_24870 [Kurthia sibirica]